MTVGLAVACVALAVGLLVAGGAILRSSPSVGTLLLVAGLGVGSALVLSAAGGDRAAGYVFAGSTAIAGALAVATYPRRRGGRLEVMALAVVGLTGAAFTATAANASASGSLGLVLVLELIVVQWWRYETGDPGERRAVLWVAVAAGAPGMVVGVAAFDASAHVALVVGAAVLSLVAPGLAVGLLLPEVVDVRGLVVRAVVFGVAVGTYLAIFVGLEAALGVTSHESASSIGLLALLGAFTAALFHPLQVVLRGVIDELLFGSRPDPLKAATSVVDLIADDPVLALRAIREALVLPYASLEVAGSEVATSGAAVTHTRRLPVGDGAELVVGLRAGDLALSSGDENVLRIVAPLLAQTLRARALAADLQDAREQTVASLEEERRRLRRDLHDGLGPTLSGIAFTADAARNTIVSDPDGADALLQRLRADTVAAVGEIRRLVYAMRPPALDELGLVAAVRQQASLLGTADGRPLVVDVQCSDVPPLSAAVEVAAYRIVLEALTNAARHSGSDRAAATLRAEGDELVVEVSDEGAPSGAWQEGVGLASMRERAAEVGGALTVSAGADGARVAARLPLLAPSRSGPPRR